MKSSVLIETVNLRAIIKASGTALVLMLFALPLSAQWLAGYDYRKQIVLDGTEIATGTHTDFPVLINITDTDLQTNALASGFDIVFTSDDGTTQLEHDLETYNSGTGEVVAWVKVTLTGGSDHTIYMYFGNTGATDQSTDNTFSSYTAVYHLEDYTDHAGSFDGDGTGHAPTQVAGRVGNGQEFDGASEYLDLGTSVIVDGTGAFTFSTWIYPHTQNGTNNHGGIYSSRPLSGNHGTFKFSYGDYSPNDGKINISTNNAGSWSGNSSLTQPALNTWTYVTITGDGTGGAIWYFNGTAEGFRPWDLPSSPVDPRPRMGTNSLNGTGQMYDGVIDELRLSTTELSAEWIETDYNNQSNPGVGGFIKTLGSLESEAPGMLSGYNYRKLITIDDANVYGSSNLSSFPLLVSLTDNYLRSTGNGGLVQSTAGYDIVFTGSDGTTQLDHQVEKYDPTTGEYIAWVRVPSLSYSQDTDIFLYYGATGASDPSTVATWSADYEAVFHMDNQTTVTNFTDNTTVTNIGASETTGRVGTALDFVDTEADRINLNQTYHTELASAMTVSAWVNIDDATQDNAVIGQFDFPPSAPIEGSWLLWMDTGGSGDSFAFGVSAGGTGNIEKVGEDATVSGIAGNWKYVVGTWDGTTMAVYVDGVQMDSRALSGTMDAQTINAGIGENSGDMGPGRPMDGQIDEVRISSVAKTGDWIRTEYFNQSNPTTSLRILGDVSEYPYEKSITINSDRVAGSTPHVSFPVLISVTDNTLRTTGNGGRVQSSQGYDIIFTNADKTEYYDHVIDTYDPTTGQYVGWVKIPSLSPSVDTEILMLYGKAGATDPSISSTWDSNYQTVWHLQDATDNTANGRDLTVTNAVTAVGIIGGGYSFDGSGDYLERDGSFASGQSDLTMSVWVKANFSNDDRGIITFDPAATGDNATILRYDFSGFLAGDATTDVIKASVETNTGLSQVEGAENTHTSNWQYLVATWTSGSTVKLYIDGLETTVTGSATAGDGGTGLAGIANVRLGDHANGDWWGLMDEVRLSSSVRSADWILTEYYNQSDPATFLTVTELCVDAGDIATPDSDLLTGGSTTIYLSDYQSGTTLQWQSSTDGTNFTDITDETSSSLETGALTQSTYYRVAVNSTACTSLSNVQTISIEPTFLTGYCYRKKITIDDEKVGGTGDLTSFPVLVSLTDPDLRSAANDGFVQNSNGFDIRFSDDAGAALDHELEYYDENSGELVAWVRVPTLSGSADTEIFMHFGNGSISADQSSTGTWDSNYKAIYHFNDNFEDATGVNDATEGAAGATKDVDGIIGRGRFFTGQANSWAEATNHASIDTDITTQVTVQAWAKVFTPHPVDAAIAVKSNTTNQERYMLGVQLNAEPGTINSRVTTTTGHYRDDAGTIDGNWHLLTMTYNSGLGSNQVKVYKNGVLAYQNNHTGTITSSTAPLRIANRSDGRQLTASVDELRVSNLARSADWLLTEYNNQNDPSSFYTVGGLSFSASGGLAQSDESFVFIGGSTDISLTGHTGTVQWQQSTDNSAFTDIGGETGTSLTTPALSESTYFRAEITNGCINYSNTVFIEARSNFIADYSYRKKISIDPSKVPSSGNLTNFPVLISLTDSDLSTGSSKVQDANGYDIIFTNLAGTQLDHDLELYDGTNGELVAWVRLPTLFANAETSIYMYYGNCGYVGGDQSVTGTWTNYNGVWHLNDNDAGSVADDRTSNGNNGTLQNFDANEAIDGFIGTGFDLDGANDRVVFGTGPLVTGAGTRTVEMWANVKNFGGGGIFTAGNGGANDFAWRVSNTEDQLLIEYDGADFTYQIEGAINSWHHYALTYDGTAIGVFVDGELIDQITGVLNTTANGTALESVMVGRWAGNDEQLTADEFRISNVARSADWLATQYANQSDPTNFLSVEGEEIEWVWKGTTDTNWSNAANWGGCNVPAAGSDVVIPSGTAFAPALTEDFTVGTLFIDAGAGLDIATFNLTVSGTIINDGTFTASSGTVTLTGSNEQYLGGTQDYVLNNLVVNKTDGKAVSINTTTINGNLDLTSGFLEVGANSLTLGPSATLSNGGHTSFILTTGSGCLLRQNLNTAAGSVLFPVGINRSSFSPATITNDGAVDDFCVRLINNVYEDGESGAMLTSEIVGRTWMIDEGTPGGSDVTLKLQWNSVEESSDFARSASFLSHYNSTGGFWEVLSTADAAADEGNNSFSRQATGVTNFSPFGLASGSSPLPIELLYFEGERQNDQVMLRWVTTAEINNDFFTIEKGRNATDFVPLTTIPGQGDSDQTVEYSYVDDRPQPGNNYYRLKQTDFDGSYTHSNVIVVGDDVNRTPELSIFPNANDGIEFAWQLQGLVPNSVVHLALFDVNGQLITAQDISLDADGNYEGKGFGQIRLQPGLYLLRANNEGVEVVRRLMVR